MNQHPTTQQQILNEVKNVNEINFYSIVEQYSKIQTLVKCMAEQTCV